MMWSKESLKRIYGIGCYGGFLPIVVIRTLIKALRQKDYQNRFLSV